MKKLNKIITALLISLLLVTVSCTNNFNSVNDNTDKNNGTESVESKKYGTLIFSESLARAVLPEITMGDFNCIQLLGLYNGNEEELANVSSLEKLNKQNILVETGNWIFTLNCFRLNNRDDLSTAYITYTDTVSVEIIEGTNNISFEVERKEFKYDSGEGDFTFILDFDPEQNVKEVIYSILDPTTMQPITVGDKEYKDKSTSVSNSKKSISAYHIPSGEYIFSAKILNADGVIVTYFSDLIVIIDEIQSRGEGVIENYNDTYKITYNYDFGELSSAAVKNFSRFNETISLENALNLRYGKFEGWYTTEDFSGEPVTQIKPTENLNDISLYAKLSKEIECKVSELDTAVAYVKGGNLTAIIKNEDFSSTALWNKLNRCNCSMTLDLSNVELTELESAFLKGQKCLEKIILPDSITVINDYAFANCKNLKEVNLPKNLTKLGNSAFGECESLTEITIPENVTKIGNSAFKDCKNIEKINYNAILCSDLTSSDLIFNFNGNNDIYVEIGNSVKYIPAYLFYKNSNLKSVKIIGSDQGCDIGQYAFNSCFNLNYLEIGKSVKTIAENSFHYCHNIAQLFYNAENCVIGSGENKLITYSAADSTASLSVTIGNNVQNIPAYLFYGTGNLTNLIIGENVKTIGSNAFANCSKLSAVFFDAIECNDAGLSDEIFLLSDKQENPLVFEFGNSVKRIPAYLLKRNRNVRTVIIGENVEYIGSDAFEYCNNITLFEYNSKKWTEFEHFSPFKSFKKSNLDVGLKITFGEGFVLPDNVFYNNKYITDIEFKSGAAIIPERAFEECEKLKNVTFADDSVTEIGKYAFYKSGIEKIVLPDSLKIINDHAFYNCSLLSEVTFGNSLEVIEFAAFYYINVESYVLPASLKYIGGQAFGYFDNEILKSVTFEDPADWEIVLSEPVDFSNPTENVHYLNASGNKYIKHGFEYSE